VAGLEGIEPSSGG